MHRIPLILSLIVLGQGCTQTSLKPPALPQADKTEQHIEPDNSASKPDYVRSGRYTLVSTKPNPDQLDLLKQIIDIQIPANTTPSVRDALQHVLQRSGYGLCEPTPSLQILYSRPLPLAHYSLGPIPLKSALQVVAGPAWQLQVDALNRTVCFVQRVEVPR